MGTPLTGSSVASTYTGLLKITDNSIIPLKERVADEYYDPAKWLMRKIRGRRSPKTGAVIGRNGNRNGG